ncbi:MAG: gamma-glutamyl-gamma-aminobutyrate hydrolase family protein [Spirochaetes bacterium]|nr:gamma-glutamyl-gamma-aminobutyrate hydrolase family protein [Spirochaetota bacterium]
MKPFIGITTGFTGEDSLTRIALREAYSNEVRRAGGTPVLLPLDIKQEDVEEYTARLDGILFSGGGDLSPHFFNEDPVRELHSFSSSRDNTELALIKQARLSRIPVFGICRGCQLINVALGGSLIQDIPSQMPQAIGHNPKEIQYHEPYHSVSILPGKSLIAGIVGQGSLRTNSFHHQAVKQLAPALRVTAQTSDGIVEAFEGEDPAWYVNCVQFHPEMMCEKYPEFRGFFSDFVKAASSACKSSACKSSA